MSQRLIQKSFPVNEVTGTSYSDTIDLQFADTLSVQAVVDVNTPAAKTFDSGKSEVQTFTMPSVAGSTGGDYFVVYDTAGLGYSVWLDKSGADAAPTGAIYVAIPAGRKARCDISGGTDAASVAALVELAFDALSGVTSIITTLDTGPAGELACTVVLHGNTAAGVVKNADDSGAGSITYVTTTAGTASEVNLSTYALTIPSHGMFEGLKVQATTTGTLPAGLSLITDYFVIVDDENTIRLASSLANALIADPVVITDEGTSNAVNTLTSVALAGGTWTLEQSNDAVNWVAVASATSITADTSFFVEKVEPTARWARIKCVVTAGSYSSENHVYVRGSQV